MGQPIASAPQPPRPTRRWRRVTLAVVGAALALLVGWVLLAGLLGAAHLRAAQASVAQATDQVQRADTAAAAASFAAVADHADGAARWLGAAPWSWLARLPWAGETVAATVLLGQVAGDVVAPLSTTAAQVLAQPPADLSGAAADLAAQADALAAADDALRRLRPDLEAVDPAALLAPVQEPVRRARDEVLALTPGLTGARAAAVVLPSLLGVDEPVDWVLVGAQPAEARGSGGGFFGAFGVMRAAEGSLTLSLTSNDAVFDQQADLSVLPPEVSALWGPAASYVWGHNLTRHYPYAATLMRQTAAGLGADPRFVVSVSPAVVTALLEVTGPVQAMGVTLDASTAQQFLTRTVYQQFPDAAQKDEVLLTLMAQVFDRLTTTAVTPAELARVLAGPLASGELVVWSADPRQQEALERTVVGGALPIGGPTSTVAVNNAGGGKMDAYLATDLQYTVTGPCEGTATGAIAVSLRLDVPPGLPRYVTGVEGEASGYGSGRMLVHVYGPEGAAITALDVDGTPVAWVSGTERGHPVWGTEVVLPAGTPVRLTATFDQPADLGTAQLLPQAMAQPPSVSVRDDRSCAPKDPPSG